MSWAATEKSTAKCKKYRQKNPQWLELRKKIIERIKTKTR